MMKRVSRINLNSRQLPTLDAVYVYAEVSSISSVAGGLLTWTRSATKTSPCDYPGGYMCQRPAAAGMASKATGTARKEGGMEQFVFYQSE